MQRNSSSKFSAMSSTHAPSTPASDPLNDVFSAMDQETPVASTPTAAQKRTRNDLSDNEDDIASGPPALLLTTQNSTQLVQRYAEKKRLRVDQIAEVNSFLKVRICLYSSSPYLRPFRILLPCAMPKSSSTFSRSATRSTPLWLQLRSIKFPPVLRYGFMFSSLKYLLKINQKTLHNFAAAILLSSRISAYKGAVPTNTLLVRVPIPFALHRGNLISEYTSEKSLRSAPEHREQAG
jgi:hypothetical protein